ncbi:MAG TPA: hypothetical protein VFT49_01795 [Candidatus Saccharimonadales bacterium]|nr:hypothetical protein [Candidatus Saccharimonadales bacterium]
MIPFLNREPHQPQAPQPEIAPLAIETELWTPGKPETQNLDPKLEKAIGDVVREMNRADAHQTLHDLQRQVRMSENSVVTAMLYGRNRSEYSDNEAMVMFNPFANMATPNMLVRAEFIRRVAKEMGVTDDKGKLKPVIMIAAPGPGHGLRLTQADREEIEHGNLGPAAKELLEGIKRYDMGKVAMLGFSQGADVALAGAQEAYSGNFDVDALSLGDPAGVHDRTTKDISKDFRKTGLGALRQAGKATGLKVQQKALLGITGWGIGGIAKFGLASQTPTNKLLWKGMTVDSFKANMQAVLDEGRVSKLVVGYGGDSAIAKPEWIEPAIDELYDENSSEAFISIKVAGANHTWGDNLELLTKLYMRALV